MVFCLFCKSQLIEAFQHILYSYILCSKCLLAPRFKCHMSCFNSRQTTDTCLSSKEETELRQIKHKHLFRRISILKQTIQENTLQLQKNLTKYLTTLPITNLKYPDLQFYNLIQNFFQRQQTQQSSQQIELQTNPNFNRFASHPHSKMGGSQYFNKLQQLGASVATLGQKMSTIREKASQIDVKSYFQKGTSLITFKQKKDQQGILSQAEKQEKSQFYDDQPIKRHQHQQQFTPINKIANLKERIDCKKQSLYKSIGNLKQQMRALKLQSPKIKKEHLNSIFHFKFF